MWLRSILFLTSLMTLISTCDAMKTDATRQPGTKGSDVVNAVVDTIRAKCIFTDDRLFLRRLAYVESKDGTDLDTYTAGYDGGIWKVSQAMFNATTSCGYFTQHTCDLIRTGFGIDWTNVKWSDLRKPLYSGLAAILYLETRLGSASPNISGTLQGQADLWAHYYHLGTPHSRNFIELAAEATHFECKDPMDILFILDSSGSIRQSDFDLSLKFVASVVDVMNIPKVAHVAVMTFSTRPHININFNQHLSKAQLKADILSITQDQGSTLTHLALDEARNTIFTGAGGARSQAKRVAVLVTDGQSNAVATAKAARRLRNEARVTTFALGVTGYNLQELHAIASEPKCSHTFTLPDFSVIDSIVYEIQRSTCKASQFVVPNKTVEVTGETIHLTAESGPGSIEFNVNCGIATIYVSYTNPNPNPAVYTHMIVASEGHPGYLTTNSALEGHPVYLTVIGTNLHANVSLLKNCSDFSVNVTKRPHTVNIKCMVNEQCTECTDQQIKENGRIIDLFPCNHESSVDFANPCTASALAAGHVLFPFPYDPHKFIRCDYHGNPYVTLCPNQLLFNPTALTCGYTNGGTGGKVPLPSTYRNPCTPAHIQAQYLYFTYDPDKTKFIHCDLFGGAWLVSCPVLEVWDQKQLVCKADSPHPLATTAAPVTIPNPCTPEVLAAGQYFHPYPCDHTRFIHCDVTGKDWVQSCYSGAFYDPKTFICVPSDPQTHSDDC